MKRAYVNMLGRSSVLPSMTDTRVPSALVAASVAIVLLSLVYAAVSP